MSSTASQLPTPNQASDDGKSRSPHFILIERKPTQSRKPAPLIQAWNQAIELHFTDKESVPFTVLEGGLLELSAQLLECDCMVSPANSFGIMDGGYDDVLSHAFRGDTNNYWTLTNHVQAYLKREWHGYLPPGSCAIVPLPAELAGSNNPWKARFLAVLPTMRVPDNVSWHQDLIYNCMWSLQVAIENWNKTESTSSSAAGIVHVSPADDVNLYAGVCRTVHRRIGLGRVPLPTSYREPYKSKFIAGKIDGFLGADEDGVAAEGLVALEAAAAFLYWRTQSNWLRHSDLDDSLVLAILCRHGNGRDRRMQFGGAGA